ncbi:sensor histidine kinase [Flaviaesturariibacter amylovorans]|uniref:histidine kinase n=1 Tax=Flaviaesturariibacter amylovorans TaxID=1084520 RepID=A0ABP8GUH1_9BACT
MTTLTTQAQFLSTLFDAIPQSVTWSVPVFSEEGIIVDFEIRYANESGGIHIGVSQSQFVGTRIFSGIALEPATRERIWQQYIDVYRSGKKLEDTYYDPLRGKYLHVVRTRADEGILTLATDVTEGQRAQQALIAQTEMNRKILDASINGVLLMEPMLNGDGTFRNFVMKQANRRFEEISGIPFANAEGRTMSEVFPNVSLTELEQFYEVIRTDVPLRKVVTYHDGRVQKWYDVSVVKLGTGCVLTYTNVSEHYLQQAALEQQALELQGILESTETRVLVLVPELDAAGRLVDATIRLVNRAYADFKKSSPEALTKLKASQVFPPQHLENILRQYRHTLETGAVSRFDLHCDDPGRIFWVDVTVTLLGTDLLVTITDYTQMRLLQLQLEQKVRELERSNRNLEEFAYAASHDLKEPIRKVRFFVDRLRQQYDPARDTVEAQTFGRLEVATDRMRDLVDDLLAYAQVSLRPKQLDAIFLDDVLRQVLTDLEVEAEQRAAEIEIAPLPRVRGQQRQLQQLFQNLLANALKYQRPGVAPRIAVQARVVWGYDTAASLGPDEAAGRYHLISVSDNGIGFEPAEAERIFQVFHRLHGNSEYRGTGVGLAIARKVAENHGGFIYAEGIPGQGATFFVGIPAEA